MIGSYAKDVVPGTANNNSAQPWVLNVSSVDKKNITPRCVIQKPDHSMAYHIVKNFGKLLPIRQSFFANFPVFVP